ncbi:MAG: lipoyl synthase [Actinobacteria bacterium]|nr:lipoyl synthase [Actinomycetota bacterium]MCI0678547.1 lipoyl synthase [Actinomycetota bacterium]
MSVLRTRWLGRLPYEEVWDLQRAFHEGKTRGRTDDDYLLLVEHPPVFTIGRNGDGSNLLVDHRIITERGGEVHHVDRGGDITFHGPGQLVGYPILSLDDPKQIVPYVRRLEETLIRVASDLGAEAWREDGLTGVWTAKGKIAAIGVRVARRVTMHGFALNLHPDMTWFGLMNPCGITDRPVTSLSELLGSRVSIEEAVEALVPRFVEIFGYDTVDAQKAAYVRGQGRESGFEVDRLLAAGTFSPEARAAEPVLIEGRLPGEPERPEWMRVRARFDGEYLELKKLMRGLDLHTVCEEANCPNIFECWGMGTATLMILGDKCTRACSFCNVTTGKPTEYDVLEPFRAAEAISRMGLSHAVITSVNRDDLADGGAGIFAKTIVETRRRSPGTEIEVLIPDFKGDREALQTVMDARPEVLNHNTETVLRLQRDIRTSASYGRSLALLWRAKQMYPEGLIKSGLIVGMGETEDEVLATLADMRSIGVDIVTIGQYLRPTTRHRPIHRYVHPDEFARYKDFGEGIGIPHVESGPLVRSSYHAKESRQSVPVAIRTG